MKNTTIPVNATDTKILIKSRKYGDFEVLVDSDKLDVLRSRTWGINKQGNKFYARSGDRVLMHRLLLGFPSTWVDHKNNNTLDNRAHNIRSCSPTQNQANSNRSRFVSKFKGVMVESRYLNRTYRAQITVNGKRIHSKIFNTEEAAAKAYNLLAIEYFGEFASLNVVDAEYAPTYKNTQENIMLVKNCCDDSSDKSPQNK